MQRLKQVKRRSDTFIIHCLQSEFPTKSLNECRRQLNAIRLIPATIVKAKSRPAATEHPMEHLMEHPTSVNDAKDVAVGAVTVVTESTSGTEHSSEYRPSVRRRMDDIVLRYKDAFDVDLHCYENIDDLLGDEKAEYHVEAKQRATGDEATNDKRRATRGTERNNAERNKNERNNAERNNAKTQATEVDVHDPELTEFIDALLLDW
jgi:hypothetical protein